MIGRRFRIVGLVSCVIVTLSCAPKGVDQEIEQTTPVEISGPYLGQPVPGDDPVVFAPGVVNTETRGAFGYVFTAAGNEVYFTMSNPTAGKPGGIGWMRIVDGTWSEPELLPFDSPAEDNDATVSLDGQNIVFRSWHALPDGTEPENHSWLWIARRGEDGWTTAEPLLCGGKPVRTGFPSMTRDGSLYFAHRRDDVVGVYRSNPVEGGYSTPELVVATEPPGASPGDLFVDRDERFIIVSLTGHPGNVDQEWGDLYVMHRLDDGEWSEAVPLGPAINTDAHENCPQVTPDGRFFIFNRYDPDTERGESYWLDIEVVLSVTGGP